jgi:hypothetical protein
MTIEEKAKRYDEALTKARNIVNSINVGLIGKDSFEAVFPELRESEDERIRKWLIKDMGRRLSCWTSTEVTKEQVLAWLEKQGEQKPAWSEEDGKNLEKAIWYIEKGGKLIFEKNDKLVSWLKSLKDRVQPQQESDERNKLLGKLEEWLDEYVSDLADVDTATLISSFTNYLDGKLPKSIRPKKQWRPSDEQLKSLQEVIDTGYFTSYPNALETLYEQIKQL